MKNLILIPLFLSLGACAAMKTKILDAGAVSMTRGPLVAGESVKETGPVTGQFCPDSFSDKGHIGLIDESVKNAQEQSHVDLILNASFYQQGTCTVVEGTGGKVVSKSSEATEKRNR